ncbi:MAG: hypothetical protein HN356_07065 [Calditrichaeota bacterium]|nr:hypothetical protein [Calditrichota bacterium]MBT7616877.1 hypothetical protein [Calditrichota bacterium]MBT7789289.1 hypothetical protein [Calditrichota bacterium]
MKQPKVWHPFLFAVYSILFLFAHNISQVSFADLPFPSLLIFSGVIVLWGTLLLIFRNWQLTGVIVTTIILAFFSYGHAHDFIQHHDIILFNISRHRHLFPIYVLLILMVSFFAFRRRNSLETFTRFLNIATIFLVVFVFGEILWYQLFLRPNTTFIDNSAKTNVKDSLDTQTSPPDVYYIILDMYPSNKTLIDYYDTNVDDFEDFLREKGFYIVPESVSNYSHTLESLPSSLNMEYLTFSLNQKSLTSTQYAMIRNSRVMQFLKERGYSFVLVRSGLGPTDRNPLADVVVNCGDYSEYLDVMNQTTMLVVLYMFDSWSKLTNTRRAHVIGMFDEMMKMDQYRSPKFVLAHFLVPHPPFIFGPNGENRVPEGLSLHSETHLPDSAYINQIEYVNKQMKLVIDDILATSDQTPIIIVQGDHGPWQSHFDEDTDEFLKERFGILNAILLPGVPDDSLSAAFTPVNNFRLVFNHAFGSNYEILEDKCYYNNEVSDQFLDVTDRVLGD